MRTIIVPKQQKIYFGDIILERRGMSYFTHIGKTYKNKPINTIHIFTFYPIEIEIPVCVPQKEEGKIIDSIYIDYKIYQIQFRTIVGSALAKSDSVYWTFKTEKERDEIYAKVLEETAITIRTKIDEDKSDLEKTKLLVEDV
jgi:hypothetical protein